MVRQVNEPGFDPLDRLNRSGRLRARRSERRGDAERAQKGRDETDTDGLPSELQSLIDRVRHGEAYRLERVHEVLEKIQRGELVNSETVRRAAERILSGGV